MYENPEIAFGGTADLLSLIELIYSAVDQPALWPTVLEGIANAAGGESTALFARFPKDSVIALTRFEPGSFEEYAEHYSNVNILMPLCDNRFPDGTIRYSHLVMEDREFENTEFYADFFRRWNMHYSFGVKVPLDELPAAYISCQRPKSKGPFEDREGLIFQTLLPHLHRALKLHLRFSQVEAKAKGLESALDAFGHAVFGLDRCGRVILSNRQAEAIVQKGDALRVSQGKLTAVLADQNHRLQEILSGAVAAGSGFGLSAGSWLLVEGKSAEQPLRLAATPVRFPLSGYPGQLAALVYVSDPSTGQVSRAQALHALYGLTPTETRVADLLAAGLEVREISERLGMALETARFHTKRILTKTGVRRQSELVRMMLTLPEI